MAQAKVNGQIVRTEWTLFWGGDRAQLPSLPADEALTSDGNGVYFTCTLIDLQDDVIDADIILTFDGAEFYIGYESGIGRQIPVTCVQFIPTKPDTRRCRSVGFAGFPRAIVLLVRFVTQPDGILPEHTNTLQTEYPLLIPVPHVELNSLGLIVRVQVTRLFARVELLAGTVFLHDAPI